MTIYTARWALEKIDQLSPEEAKRALKQFAAKKMPDQAFSLLVATLNRPTKGKEAMCELTPKRMLTYAEMLELYHSPMFALTEHIITAAREKKTVYLDGRAPFETSEPHPTGDLIRRARVLRDGATFELLLKPSRHDKKLVAYILEAAGFTNVVYRDRTWKSQRRGWRRVHSNPMHLETPEWQADVIRMHIQSELRRVEGTQEIPATDDKIQVEDFV